MEILQSGEFWAVTAGVLWAVAVILFKLAGEEIDPLPLNLFKGVVALAVFLPLLALSTASGGWPSWDAGTWTRLVASGIVGIAAADTFFFMALNRLGAGLNAMVSCLYFPVMAVMAAIYLGDSISALTVAGAGLVILGIIIGSLGSDAGPRTRHDLVVGLLIGLAAVLTLSGSVIVINGIVKAESVLWTTSVRLVAGLVVITPIVLLGSHRDAALGLLRPSKLWRHALPGAILGGALAMLAWIAGFSRTSVAIAAILNQLSTIYVFVLAWLILKEPMTMRRAIAVAAAFAGAAIVILSTYSG
jgi:drug/metabolite transporter (DMT)-like permease